MEEIEILFIIISLSIGKGRGNRRQFNTDQCANKNEAWKRSREECRKEEGGGGGPLHVLNEIKTAGISSRTHEIIIDILDGYKDN